LNQSVLLDVTSDSSEEYDKTEKLACYLTIPSLGVCSYTYKGEYIVVSHRDRRITIHAGGEGGSREKRVRSPTGACSWPVCPAELSADEIYRGSAIG
jgi:hypothetical protein